MPEEKEKRKINPAQSQRQIIIAIVAALGVLAFGIFGLFAGGESDKPAVDACGDLPRTQLAIGDTVQPQITQAFAETGEIYLYEQPSSGELMAILNETDTALVIAGPRCIDNGNEAARHWKLQTNDGIQGWTIEVSASSQGYLLLPVDN